MIPRILLALALAAAVAAPLAASPRSPVPPDPEAVAPRARVIIDNDFGGDPDGLFQLAQHLLSPSVEIRGVIGSHNYARGFYGDPGSAAYACVMVQRLLRVMNLEGKVPVYEGANSPMGDDRSPVASAGARFIASEAMRDDLKTPLYVACGGGLTDIASACLMEPRIAKHLTLVWIGGPEYAGVANPPPGRQRMEYNLGMDLPAAEVIFNHSDVPLWQVPRDAYRQALVSDAELRQRMDRQGELGGFLLGRLEDIMNRAHATLGEAYVLGDSPLVLLTALQSAWEPDPSSSRYLVLHAPRINGQGQYVPNPGGRPIRVYTRLDTRMLFADLFAKVARFDRAGQGPRSVAPLPAGQP